MNLTVYSRNRIMKTFSRWNVTTEFADPMYNYLVHGYNPGSCFTAVLANDFYNAIGSSHPANTVLAFKSLAGWIKEYCPTEAYSSYAKVKFWCDLDTEDRRATLEHNRLIYAPKEETWLALKEPEPDELVLY